MTELYYIYHDCFLLKCEECNIIFDFWKDPTICKDELPNFFKIIDYNLPLYVLVSHHHKDHFNRDIFKWSKFFRSIKFIISKDTAKSIRYMLRPDSIYTGERPDKESVIVLHHGDSFNDGIININAFDSTDTGNSYLLTINRKHIFHAGDLNAWVWKDESTKAEIDAAIRNFKKILETIKICTNTIDIAMFPVDSRIGKEYWEGASIFVQEFEVKHFFPMHFELGETDEQRNKLATDARRFQDYANDNSKGDYIALQSPYAVYRFSDL